MVASKQVYEALCGVISGKGEGPGWGGWVEADWLALASLAQAQGVAALAFWTFQQTGWPEGMPQTSRKTLSEAYYANAGYTALLGGELTRLVAAFSRANIPVMVLKGLALAEELYPAPGVRMMSDLDLLVHGKDAEAAMQVLRSCGYSLHKAIYHMVFQGGEGRKVSVELHWSLMARDPGYMERLWGRGQAWRVNPEYAPEVAPASSAAFRLNPIDNLLYLSAHLMLQHPGSRARLAWFYDIHRLLLRYSGELDWACVLEEAMAAGWTQPLRQAMLGVQERFGDEAYSRAFLRAEEAQSRGLEEGQTRAPVRTAGWKERWTWEAMSELRWRMRVRMLWSLLLPHPDYVRWRYQPKPTWLWPVYYPVRWWQMAREGLASRKKTDSPQRRRVR